MNTGNSDSKAVEVKNDLTQPLMPPQQQYASPIGLGLRPRCRYPNPNTAIGAAVGLIPPLTAFNPYPGTPVVTVVTGSLAAIPFTGVIECITTEHDNAYVLNQLEQDTGREIDPDLMEKSNWCKHLLCCLICTGTGTGLGAYLGNVAAGMLSGMFLWGTGTSLKVGKKVDKQITAEQEILASLPRNAV